MKMISIQLDNGAARRVPVGTPACALLARARAENGPPYIGCRVNNDVMELSAPLATSSKIKFLTMADPQGMLIYRRSLTFLAAKTASALFPKSECSIEHSLGTGFFFRFTDAAGRPLTKRQVEQLEQAMREQAARCTPITRRTVTFAEALKLFARSGRQDTVNLLRFRNPPLIELHQCEDFFDLDHGPLTPDLGALTCFKLINYPPGFVLQLPAREHPGRVTPFRDQPHLFQIFHEHKQWGRILGVTSTGRLNELIVDGGVREFIRIQEALHEKKLAQIADQISVRRRQLKVILISGPSAAGKTTFAKRLAVQLEVNGLKPIMISLDNYYQDDSKTPRDREGRPDYEHIEALDIALFNRHLLRLIDGRPVTMPRFEFGGKRRAISGATITPTPDQIIIIEGIHGLNPRLTHSIPKQRKFKIYISALTQLNIDAFNRISTTDNRLMRRMVRDHAYRGNAALATMRMWPSVRSGEKKWVFPFQSAADATFNSALDYELAVLKPLAEPLLMEIKPMHAEYSKARRLQEFLSNFLPVSPNDVPPTSILREYIGASGFQY